MDRYSKLELGNCACPLCAVDAAEKGAPHTARRDVVVGRVSQTHQMFAGSGHGENLT